MFRKLMLCLLLVVPLMFGGAIFAGDDITVTIDNEEVEFKDVEPFIDEDDRTQVPVRFISEEVGADVDWDEATETVTIEDEGRVIELVIGVMEYTVNGETKEMDTAPRIVDARTVVPLRFVVEGLGLEVNWIAKTNTVAIETDIDPAPQVIGERIEYTNEVVKILDENDNVIFEYTYEEFIAWAEENWEDIFEEVPSFHQDYYVYPEYLSYFEDTATLSPCGKKFAFSVNDYYAAAHMSFVGVVNLETGETDLVDKENRGRIEKFYWSPEGNYLAYALNAAEGEGFFLSNDNVELMSKEFTLEEEELRETLNAEEYSLFHTYFRNLAWKEDESKLKFISNSPEDKEAEEIKWNIDPSGENLIKEEPRVEEKEKEEPAVEVTRGNTTGNISNLGLAVKYEDWIYFSRYAAEDGIYRVRPDGSKLTRVDEEEPDPWNINHPQFINVKDDWIYFANRQELGEVFKIRTDGSERTHLIEDRAKYVSLVGNWIYYKNRDDDGAIYKARTDGSERTKLNDEESEYINVVDDWIYYSNNDDGSKLYRMKTDGSSQEQLSDDRATKINVKDEWIYYLCDKSFINKMRTDGSKNTEVHDEGVSFLNVVEDTIYYSNIIEDHNLYKINTDGTGRTQLNEDHSISINVAGEWIFYENFDDNKEIYKVRTDGSEYQRVE